MRAIVRYLPLLALFCVSSCTSESVPAAGSAGDSLGATAGVPETEDQKILKRIGPGARPERRQCRSFGGGPRVRTARAERRGP